MSEDQKLSKNERLDLLWSEHDDFKKRLNEAILRGDVRASDKYRKVIKRVDLDIDTLLGLK